MLVVRVASVALVLTGISQELARFQARSAFTGAGFTTNESEKVVQHPVRRRIILLLMLLGNAGIITVVSSLVLSFVNVDQSAGWAGTYWFRILALTLGLLLLWLVAHSAWIDHHLSRLIKYVLKRWTTLEVRDYAGLLHLAGGYAVAELKVNSGDWLAEQTLEDLNLFDEGILVLGIEKPDSTYLGAPRGAVKIRSGDTVILYGPQVVIENLDQRSADRKGGADHARAMSRQERVEADELRKQQDLEGAQAQSPARGYSGM
ncbi:MAG: TrkA C-terminal domain-containing protein [Gemmataceae bacterium]